MSTDIEIHNAPTVPAVSYTINVLSTMQSKLGHQSFIAYAKLVIRIFQGTHSAAASANTMSLLFADCPIGACLHNAVARMTHDMMLIFNLPELDGNEMDEEVDDALLYVMDCFEGHEGQRVVNAYLGRVQVLEYIMAVADREKEGNAEVEEMLAGLEMLSMG